MPDTFHCSVVTPERAVLDCEASFVALPAHDGEIGIMRGRAPLLCRLGIGELRIKAVAENHVFFIDGGFAQMVDNRLTLLTEEARRPDEIDAEAVAEALKKAREIPAGAAPDRQFFDTRQRAIQRAKVQRKLSRAQTS